MYKKDSQYVFEEAEFNNGKTEYFYYKYEKLDLSDSEIAVILQTKQKKINNMHLCY